MRNTYSPKNDQQPILSENQMLIKPVDSVVCPEAVYLLQQIRHPALPALRGVDQQALDGHEPCACFLFDFLPGTSLDQLMDEERAEWSLENQLLYFAEVARVVDFLHTQGGRGLLHLDIKPSNLLLGPDLRPRLIDFGAMRFAGDSVLIQSKSTGGERGSDRMEVAEQAVACTPDYAAPELLQGRPCPASDIFAIGLTLLNTLLDFDPVQGYQAALPTIIKTLPSDVSAIISRCLMSLPEQRYASAADLAVALEQAANHLSQHPESPVIELVRANDPPVSKLVKASDAPESKLVKESDPSEDPASPVVKKAAAPGKSANQPGPANESSCLMCVWDGAEFGCELAVQLRKYYSRVLVIDGDLVSPQADLLLGKRTCKSPLQPGSSHDNLNLAMAEIERGTLNSSRLQDLVWSSLTEQVDLLVFGASLDEYDHIPPESFLRLIEISRLTYPVIVLLCSRFIYDAFTCLGLMTADQVLIPLAGHAASFRAFNRSIDFLVLRRQIDPDRISFIPFPYDERTDLSLGTLDVLSGGRLIGSVQTSLNRQRQRGSARPYACAVSAVNEKEYDGIIARLSHKTRKENADADHYLARTFRRTVRLLSRQAAAAQ